MEAIFKELKIQEPENYNKFKRLEDLSQEITRLECVLSKGMVTKQMFDKLVLKLNNLENEHLHLHSFLIMKLNRRENGLSDYHNDYLNCSDEIKKKIRKKFKFNKCGWCDCLIPERDVDDCPDSDCESHRILHPSDFESDYESDE